MTTANKRNQNEGRPWIRLLLFVLFLILLALILNRLGWCIGGVCEVGADMMDLP